MEKKRILPLEGVKVIDFSTFVAAPTAARVMADWGAEVIKIEPAKGDDYRSWGEIYGASITDDENPMFAVPNINKTMISINVKEPEGFEILKKMISLADVFITNVRWESLKKLNLSYEYLKTIKPDIIYAFLSGFGINGADATRAGFDAAAFWTRGALCDWKDTEEFPVRPPVAFGDMVSAGWFLAGILAAINGRQQTGQGTFLSTALYSNSIWCGSSALIYAQERYGNPVSRSNGKNSPNSPFMTHYQCKDGGWLWLGLQNYNAGGYKKTCKALGLDDLVDDERYSTLKEVKKPEHLAEFLRLVRARFMTKTAVEWSELLVDADIVHEIHRRYRDIPKDSQAWENDFLRRVTFPSGADIVMANPPVAFSQYDTSEISIPTSVGRDTRKYLSGIGYSDDEIERMKQGGVIK